MIEPFVYNGLPARVVFGWGTLDKLPEEVDRLGIKRALVLSTPPQEESARDLAKRLGPSAAGVFPGATMHTPVEVTEKAMTVVRELGVDGTVAVGGGSTTGLGKAIALRTGLPQLVVPTTYAGSEMTPIIGESRDGLKSTQTTLDVLPETVIYDVDLTMTLPASLSGTSGVNAVAHAVEALYARERNPIVNMMSQECIAAMARALPRIAKDPSDRAARGDALYGAWLGGAVLALVGMSLHHKLCHTIGGSFDLPHAETHTIVLAHAAAYNAPAAPDAMARIAQALQADDAARGLFDLAKATGAKMALRDLGMPEEGIDKAADLAVQKPYWNPRPIEREPVRALIARAWAGEPPQVS